MSAINFSGSAYQNQNQQQENTDTKKHVDKIIVDPFPFPSLFEVMYTDSEEFPTMINGLLRPLFVDYYGSKVEIVQGKQLYTTIFFCEKYGYNYNNNDNDEGPYAAIERIIQKNSNSTADARIQTLNHMSNYGKSKLFKLTKRAESMLQDLINPGFINHAKGTVDWNKVVYESSAILQNGTMSPTPYVQVAVDVNKILQCIYGGYGQDGEWQYMVSVHNPINPISSPHGAISNKWQLFITRVNTKDAQDIASQFGFVIGSNNMGIITK